MNRRVVFYFMKHLVLFSILLLSLVFLFQDSYAQDLGETERYRFFVDENETHEITFQSHVTKFNELRFDSESQSIIASVSSDPVLDDIILIYLDYDSFRELFSKEHKIEPTDILILLDGEEEGYEVMPTSSPEDSLVVWKFESVSKATEIELTVNSDVEKVTSDDDEWNQYAISPLKQIKNGVALDHIKCNEEKIQAYKFDMANVSCVSEKTKDKLVERGWAVKDPGLSYQNRGSYLCNAYDGDWSEEDETCKSIAPKQCSLMGGWSFFPYSNTCDGNNNTCKNENELVCTTDLDHYLQIIEGMEISLEGVIVDHWGGSHHSYHFFTNEPYMKFFTGSDGINLEGLNQHDDLNGKMVKLYGTHAKRDLAIDVKDFEILDSLIPYASTHDSSVYDVTLEELINNSERYYNQTVIVSGNLEEYEYNLGTSGVGCNTARYAVSDEFVSDFPSSRHLNDGDKRIGVRIGTHDDLGKVDDPLFGEFKPQKVEIVGLFVPHVVEKGGCDHIVYRSGYLLTEFNDIKIDE